jgi:hypothetical protein
MNKKYTFYLLALLKTGVCFAQSGSADASGTQVFSDSARITVHGSYNKVGGLHRWLFGENYRREWATEVKLPLIDVKKFSGGLIPVKYGGGMQTRSIHMRDSAGTDWVIRSVEKIPDKIVPVKLRQTFAIDWVDDSYSGQHPYSALIVPPLADAAGVPHTNPIIGVLVPNEALGSFGHDFAGRAVLLEQHEPGGHSENTEKLLRALNDNNNISINGAEFLRARMLDVLIGDWDRHVDQWRWMAFKEGKERVYTAIPRDRDQVIHVLNGVFPSIVGLPWIDPVLGDFNGRVRNPKYSPLYKSNFLFAYPSAQLSHDQYTRIVNDFVKAETDDVLEAGLKRLPPEDYKLRHQELLMKFKQRRDDIPRVMETFYRFVNRLADIRLSNGDEDIAISDGADQGMHITVTRHTKGKENGSILLDMNYLPSVTSEVRLYTMAGNDHVSINTSLTPLRLRIVDSTGMKHLIIQQASKAVDIYGYGNNIRIEGDSSKLRRHFSADSSNAKYVQSNPYNVWMPLVDGEINRDDGLLLGLGARYTGKDGFRKLPFSNRQEVLLTRSFKTNAFRVNYEGQWMAAVGKADLTLKVLAETPDNTMNFFGQGNETVLDKTRNYRHYYRARFNLYRLDPAIRWHTGTGSTFSVGPSLQYYTAGLSDNVGRAVAKPGLITSYDSLTYHRSKLNLGVAAGFIVDRRNDKMFPSNGFYFSANLIAYSGANKYSRAFVQFRPEFTYYLKVDTGAALVLSDRVGGGVSIGNMAYYQSMFLGGQGNLLGFLQNRFAGRSMIFNNLQFRLRLANIPGYVLPGQLGLTGFYDLGRVWVKDDHSDEWHQGIGGGVYFAPASLTVIQVIAGHSKEGWYPYVSLKFRL